MMQIIELSLGEQRIDIRDEIGSSIDKALREPHWVPRVAGVWKEGEEYGRLNIVSKDGSAWLAKRDHPTAASTCRRGVAGRMTARQQTSLSVEDRVAAASAIAPR